MGRFMYGATTNAFEIEDRTLAHIRVVVMNKLRRSESFMFDLTMGDGSGSRSFWINAAVPIQFQFFGSRSPRLNRAWIELLMTAANGPKGLTILPEPAEPALETPGTGIPHRESARADGRVEDILKV
ncbi:DUF7882 family protein [Microbacterium sp. P5_E9]